MEKEIWKAGNMVYPLPAVMVSTADKKGRANILTVPGRHCVYQSGHGVYFCASGKIQLFSFERKRGICH